MQFGLKESKKVSDSRAFALEKEIKKIAPCDVIAIGPEKYNELQLKIGNLNRLLAWGHARALENLLAKVNPLEVISDQFGDKRLIEKALSGKGPGDQPNPDDQSRTDSRGGGSLDSGQSRVSQTAARLSTEYGLNSPKGPARRSISPGRGFYLSREGMNLAKSPKSISKTRNELSLRRELNSILKNRTEGASALEKRLSAWLIIY